MISTLSWSAHSSRTIGSFLLLLCIALSGCGGGGSSGGGGQTAPAAPTALTYPGPLVLVAGFSIGQHLPSVNGSDLTYSFSPSLPGGLVFHTNTGMISGTPLWPTPPATYRMTASNSAGATHYDLLIEVQAPSISIRGSTPSRIVTEGSSIAITMVIEPGNFPLPTPLHVKSDEPFGYLDETITVVDNADGSHSLTFTTRADAPESEFLGPLTLRLCQDAECSVPQTPERIALPFRFRVMATHSWRTEHLSALEAWPEVPEWQTFQGNMAHTGYVPAPIDINRLSVRWQRDTVDLELNGHSNRTATLATTAGRVITSNARSQMVYAREEFDGSPVWQHDFSELPFPSVNPPSVVNGTVYVAAGQQDSTALYALDASDGSMIFSSPMSGQWEHYLAPAVGPQGVYTNAGTFGGLYGFALTGEPLFFASQPQTTGWTPTIDDSGVYTYVGGALQKRDAVTGNVLRAIDIANPYERGTPVLGAAGSVFTTTYASSSTFQNGIAGNMLSNFDTVTNALRWQTFGFYSTAVAYHDGEVVAANDQPLRLEARAETNGQLLWSWVPQHPSDARFISGVVLTPDLVFISTNHSVYAIDRASHVAVWSYPASGQLAISPNGILYIETTDQLIAINLK